MKVLLVGGGAREHALAWKFAKSPELTALYLWPGHVLSCRLGTALDLKPSATFEELKFEILRLNIDAVICGPEQPLADGLADHLEGIPVFGPKKAAAALESSKSFAKEVMKAAGIPTAEYVVTRSEQECRQVSLEMLKRTGGTVLKASGLAAGKGVFVCKTAREIDEGLERLFGSMKEASHEVVVETVLEGRECSYFTFIGPEGPSELCFAVDHKRLLDGDLGPNTGGMGCYAPVPWLPENAGKLVEDVVVIPLLSELKRRGIDYTGVLYVGLMWGHQGPKVVEFNVRFGDPECEVLAVADHRDWLAMILSKLGLKKYEFQPANLRPSVSVVMASSSYPYGETEDQPGVISIDDLSDSEDSVVFASAIRANQEGEIRTGKGRVFVVVSEGDTFKHARAKAYSRVAKLQKIWAGSVFRADIAKLVE
jgi:phosphoribosylamine--glycine ligase